MARTLDQILTELNSVYQPSAQNIQSQMDLIPQQTQASISAADAAQQKAYQDILSGAQQRGLGFSGIPLGEQAKYASTVYAPAVLQAKAQGEQNKLSLADMLNKLDIAKYNTAQTIQQNEMQNELDAAKIRAQYANAASSAYTPSLGDLLNNLNNKNNQNNQPTVDPNAHPKNIKTDKGYVFTDANNNPITMLQYAQAIGKGSNQLFGKDILVPMAKSGDRNAQIALKYITNNFNRVNRADIPALQALGIKPNSIDTGTRWF